MLRFFLGDLLADLMEKPQTDVTAVVAVNESMFQVAALVNFTDRTGGTSDVWLYFVQSFLGGQEVVN